MSHQQMIQVTGAARESIGLDSQLLQQRDEKVAERRATVTFFWESVMTSVFEAASRH
jgi:hypothetical protein